MGIEKLKEVAKSAAKILNAASAAIHKQGLLLALYAIVAEFESLRKVDWKSVLLEIKDLSQAEGDEVEAAFKAELKLQNPANQAKVSDAIDLIQDGIQLGVDGVQSGVAIYGRGKAWFEKLKSLVA